MNAEKIKKLTTPPTVTLASAVEGPFRPKRKGFWEFLKYLFLAPDLDLKRYERLETKRTRHQIELEKFF